MSAQCLILYILNHSRIKAMGSSEMKLGAVLVPEDRHPQVSALAPVTVASFRVELEEPIPAMTFATS